MSLHSVLLASVFTYMWGCSGAWAFVTVLRVPTSTCGYAEATTAGVGCCRTASEGMRRPRPTRRGITTMMARGSALRPGGESKRQARVSQLMTAELAEILRVGHGIKTNDKIADSVRCKISVVDVNMSPDLRSANVFVSVYGDVLEKREAYAWCVKNTKAIRRALAANLKDMKRVPELYFKDTDIGAAVDLMALIDRVGAEDEVAAAARGGDADASEPMSEEDLYTFNFDEGEDEDVEGFEGLTEKDFFTFGFDDDDDEDD